MRKLWTVVFIPTLLLAITPSLYAVDLTVQATVLPVCTLSIPAPLDFGDYSGILKSAQTNLQVTCNQGADFSIALNGGSSNDVNNRTMKNGSSVLNYQLYQDASYNQVWGDKGNELFKITNYPGGIVNYPVYGQIPARQYPAAGDYVDTVQATLTVR